MKLLMKAMAVFETEERVVNVAREGALQCKKRVGCSGAGRTEGQWKLWPWRQWFLEVSGGAVLFLVVGGLLWQLKFELGRVTGPLGFRPLARSQRSWRMAYWQDSIETPGFYVHAAAPRKREKYDECAVFPSPRAPMS